MIEWTVTSSALILLVMLLRVLVKDRVNPRLRYALWGLVLLRLLIPGTLWESRASVMTPVAAQEEYQTIERIPRYVRTRPDGWLEIGHENGWTSIPQERLEDGEPVRYGWPERTEAGVETLRRQVNIRDALLLAWLAGIAAVSLFLLAVNLSFARRLKKRRWTLEKYRGRWVFVLSGLATPCLFGLFQPAIYLTPEVAADETARKNVLAHEYAHFRQGDHLWAVLRGVCLAVHWYNPLVWLAAYLSRRDCELSCDEGAVRLLGEDHRAAYGRTLVGLVARRTTPKDLACCATTMTGGKSALKERIALLVKRPRTTVWMACLVAAACAVFAVCTFTGAAAEEPDEPSGPVQAEQDAGMPPPGTVPAAPPADVVMMDIPEDLPTELMDLERPAAEQGEWLLLAQTPGFDIALYRSAWDDQHVYLRVTNQSFQRFDRDLTGMELLPTLEVVDGDADMTVRALYRRYEGTYFNGTSYEPGIVADQRFYNWSEAGQYWTEWAAGTQPAQILTEDLPALADLPAEVVVMGGRWEGDPLIQSPIWLLAELPEEDIAVYWDLRNGLDGLEGRSLIRYGECLQYVEERLASSWPPELHYQDFDGDGEKELAVIYSPDGQGMLLSVYEWDGQRWTGTTYDPSGIIEDFNRQRSYAFYEDGTAYISYDHLNLLLDLSNLWELGYWDSPPDVCVLSREQSYYRYEDGQIMLVLGGEIVDTGGHFLHGYTFEYDCPVTYWDGHLISRPGTLRSDFAIEPQPPELTDGYRTLLRSLLAMSDPDYTNVFAVHDINGDGQEELIVRWMPKGAIASAWGTSVYSANGKEQFHGYGELTFYDNGAISVPWSHNQGPAAAIWPYDLYVYGAYAYNGYQALDTGVSRYTNVGSARARSSEVDGFESVAYADLDGDGMVYYIGEDAYTEETPVDNDVYEAWRDRYLAGAQVLPVWYFPLTEDVCFDTITSAIK